MRKYWEIFELKFCANGEKKEEGNSLTLGGLEEGNTLTILREFQEEQYQLGTKKNQILLQNWHLVCIQL